MATRSHPRPRALINPVVLQAAAAVIRNLGHPLRLRLLELLEAGERTVTELQRGAGADQATVSRQLAILRDRGVVAAKRDGPFVRYRIVEPKVRDILACIRRCDCGPRART